MSTFNASANHSGHQNKSHRALSLHINRDTLGVMLKSATKSRIIEAAGRLFHEEGIRAVSMDAIAEKSGVTKRTLYYHFRSKDDLITAYLEARDQPSLSLFRKWFAQSRGDAAERTKEVFENLARNARHPKWKGCGFLRTSVELINLPGHPAMERGRQHKKRLETWFVSILRDELPLEEAEQVARQIVLLLDGAFSVVLLHRDPSYMLSAGDAAATLIRATKKQLEIVRGPHSLVDSK